MFFPACLNRTFGKEVRGVSIVIGVLTVLSIIAVPAFADPLSNYPRVHLRDTNYSTNWGGYAVESNLTSPANNFFTAASASWIVPTLACSSAATYSTIWVGIDGYNSNTVEQIGTEQDCTGGTQTNYAWYEIYPSSPHNVAKIPIHQGDKISASVSYLGHDRFALTIKNLSDQQSYTVKPKVQAAARSSAEWIVEPPSSGGSLPLANFGLVTFTDVGFATANGQAANSITSLGPNTYTDIKLVDQTGARVIASPSALDPSGTSFTVDFTG